MKECTTTAQTERDIQGDVDRGECVSESVQTCSLKMSRLDLECDNFLRRVQHEPLYGRPKIKNESRIESKSNTEQKELDQRRSLLTSYSPRYSNTLKMSPCINNYKNPLIRRRKSRGQGLLIVCLMILSCANQLGLLFPNYQFEQPMPFGFAEASLIIGDSAIEIQEVDSGRPMEESRHEQQQNTNNNQNEPSVILGTSPPGQTAANMVESLSSEQQKTNYRTNSMPGPLPPLTSSSVEGGRQNEKDPNGYDKAIAGKVVDFELTPAGGHNKGKFMKKKKKKKKEESEGFKKWAKKKKEEKKAHEKEHKESMKKKMEEGEFDCILSRSLQIQSN